MTMSIAKDKKVKDEVLPEQMSVKDDIKEFEHLLLKTKKYGLAMFLNILACIRCKKNAPKTQIFQTHVQGIELQLKLTRS